MRCPAIAKFSCTQDLAAKELHTNGDCSKSSDNRGAETVTCIQAVKGRKVAKMGDTIIVSVEKLYNASEISCQLYNK